MIITALQTEMAKYSGNNWGWINCWTIAIAALYNLCPFSHGDRMLAPQIVSDHPSLGSAIGY